MLYVTGAADDKIPTGAQQVLLTARSKRQQPHLDDKVLVDWNGLMISAYARAGLVLDDPAYTLPAVTAADLLNVLTFKELTKLFNKLGQEPLGFSKKLSGVIVDWRKSQKLATTGQLVDLVSRVKRGQGRIHPATKTFQALRIAVNDELNSLKTALPQAVDLLAPGGRLVVISFHSLEDRLVKNFFKGRSDLKIITKKPVRPDPEEINANPRARSAKLRAGEKL